MTALVVDDNTTNQRILVQLLRMWNMKPAAAASGSEALEMLRQANDRGDPFALVLTDCHMPEMDGFDLANRIKNSSHLADAVVMMLTSGEQQGDVKRCRELGISLYLTKPVRRADLRSAIIRSLAKRPSAAETDMPGWGAETSVRVGVENRTQSPMHDQTHDRTTTRILLVEDNTVNQRVAVRILEKHGYQVTVACNGLEALEALKSGSLDLVFMDVQMPEMGGFEATQKIRRDENPGGARIPIIAMTAHAMTGDRERCLAAGMDDYISKPLRASDLINLVEKYRPVTAI